MDRLMIAPGATLVPDAKLISGKYTGGPAKGLLHATIAPCSALPGYQNQSVAPHSTLLWNRTLKTLKPWQHYRFDNFAKALANKPGGVQTNMDTVLQFELGGYLGKTTPVGEFDILEAPNTYWEQVADIVGPVLMSWDVKNVVYPTNGGRMGYSQWDAFSGLCTHADVPENDHWDLPIPAEAVAILADKLWDHKAVVIKPAPVVVPKTKTAPAFPLPSGHVFGPKSGPYWQHSGFYSATDRAGIRTWQAQMRKNGWALDVDGFFGPQSTNVAERFQGSHGLSKDGLVGPLTWKKSWLDY